MSKTVVVVGYGPGIGAAVAERFGGEGFSIALVARSEERLSAGVKALQAKGIVAAAFPAEAGDPAAMRAVMGRASAELGPVTVIHWNAFSGGEAPDLMTTDPAVVGRVFDVAVVGLLAAVQEALPDLVSTNEGAVLVTNGAFGEISPEMDALVTKQNFMGGGLANAAKHKLVGLLAQRLKDDGVYVGEVTIAGAIKGSPWAKGGGIEGSRVASKFWELYQARDEIRARLS